MKRTSGLFASMSISIVVLALALVRPAQAQPLADRIPQDAVAYIGWSGSESMGPGYANSHLKAVVESSNLAQLASESIPRLLERIGKDDEEAQQVTALLMAIGGAGWGHPAGPYFWGGGGDKPGLPHSQPGALGG